MKNNLSWFKHKVTAINNWKLKTLRREYAKAFNTDGWAGEGKFWALNCFITDADNCKLSCYDEDHRNQLSSDLDFSPEEFTLFLEILEKKAKLITVISDIDSVNPDIQILTQDTQEMLAGVMENREMNANYKRQERIRKRAQSNMTTPNVRPDIKKSGQNQQNSHIDNEQNKKKNKNKEEEEEIKSKNSAGVIPEAGASGENDNSTGDGQGSPKNKTASKKSGVGKEKEKGSAEKEKEPFWDKILATFDSVYMIVKGRSYSWSKKSDFAHMKSIMAVLKKDEPEWTEENAVVAVNRFFSKASNMKWLRDHYSIANIYSKIDEVLSFNPEIPNLNGSSLTTKGTKIYNDALAVYINFFKKRNDGIEPSISDADEMSLCKLIAYFTQLASGDDGKVVEALKTILHKWDNIEPFLQRRMELRNIYNNINQIILQIKNPNNATRHAASTNGFHERRQSEYNKTFAETYASVTEKLGEFGKK